MRRGRCWWWVWLVASAAGAAVPAFHDAFDANDHHWRLDDQWQFEGGSLLAKGLVGKVLLAGCDMPDYGDFTARLTLHARHAEEQGNYGLGLVYRYDPRERNGYFVALGAGHGYGFGKVLRIFPD